MEVLTSCAVSYVDWANVYKAGIGTLDGVTLHRLPVERPREDRWFGPLSGRVVWGQKPVPLYLQEEWMRSQGPYIPELAPWLFQRASSYDVVIFFTYLYYTTWRGLPAAAGLAPTVLHPTAHDEPPLYLPLFDITFRLPSALAFLTREEADLVHKRFRTKAPSSIIGVGVDLDAKGDDAAFRNTYGLCDRPYLLFVGRLDPGKGSDELFDFFVAYKERNAGPLALVVVGEPVKPLPAHPDVVVTGFVDETTRRAAIAGCLALVQPSYFESFSMVLSEAWAQRKPALVQGHCHVLEGQVRRAGGGIPYRGFAEFEAAADLVVEERHLRQALGEAGRQYVERNYTWDAVMARYEALLTSVRVSAVWLPLAHHSRIVRTAPIRIED